MTKKILDSAISLNYYEEKRQDVPSINLIRQEPKDFYCLAHICCMFVGFMNIMPYAFLSTAAGYWMYKFRDPALGDTTAGENRTALQSYYQATSAAASTIPPVIFITIFTLFGHKLSAMLTTIWSFALMIGLFIIFALFTQINTDSWQTGFFVLSTFLNAVNSALMATIQVSSAVIIVRLPQEYMFYFLLGQNGTIFTAVLQIISLSVTDFQPTSGLIYFLSGASIVATTLLLLFITRQTNIFKYYNVEDNKDEKSKMIDWKEIKKVMKDIWPCQIILVIIILNVSFINPSLIALVVSQDEASKTDWTEKYFTPVTAFLVMQLGSLFGRLTSKKFFVTHSNKWWYIGFVIVRLFVTVPFYIFCNAQKRNIPVYFDKDWEFTIANLLFGFTMGFMLNIGIMSTKILAGDRQETGLKLTALILAIAAVASLGNGLLAVKMLNL